MPLSSEINHLIKKERQFSISVLLYNHRGHKDYQFLSSVFKNRETDRQTESEREREIERERAC